MTYTLRHWALGLALFTAATQAIAQGAADRLFHGATFYTVDAKRPQVTAVAVKHGRISYIGDWIGAQAHRDQHTELVDLQGLTATPGFIETHAHLAGLGQQQQTLDLTTAKNYPDIIAMVAAKVATTASGELIVGRGWHQDKWDSPPQPMVKGFQTHGALSEISAENPVVLVHASGHAVFVNALAMSLAGIDGDTIFSGFGEIIRDDHGQPTGVLNENAAALVANIGVANTADQRLAKRSHQLELGMAAALRAGITSFHDAGDDAVDIEALMALGAAGKLPLRLYLMISSREPKLVAQWFARGPLINHFDHHLSVRAIKVHGDGALGSRGAWLLEDYSDRPGHVGTATFPMEQLQPLAAQALTGGFQLAVHAIGDRSNREVLDRFEGALQAHPIRDHRFRIEHAQHLHPADIPRFGQLGVIAAMQSVHMSSDRPWAIDRLGAQRIEQGAYMWQSLLKSGARVINGSDAPVEPINPLASFYAAVSRQTLAGQPLGGYEPAQKMSRSQALNSYTLDAAFGEFNEQHKGSLAVGKLADITVFSNDILRIPAADILTTEVVMTIVGGEIRYRR